MSDDATSWFFRTAAGAEIDLVIEQGDRLRIAIEIKRSAAPRPGKGFHHGCRDIQATHRFLVYPGRERFPLAADITAMPLVGMMEELRSLTGS